MRFGGTVHHHPLLASFNIRFALTGVPGLASQTAIPASAVHSMQVRLDRLPWDLTEAAVHCPPRLRCAIWRLPTVCYTCCRFQHRKVPLQLGTASNCPAVCSWTPTTLGGSRSTWAAAGQAC